MPDALELIPSVKNRVDPDKWNSLLSGSPGATVFHTLEWIRALKAAFRGFGTKYLLVEDRSGRYVAGLPLVHDRSLLLSRYSSLPFGTYGGPVAVEGLETDVSPFLTVALQALTREILPFSFHCVLYNAPTILERALQSAFPDGRRLRATTHLIDLAPGFQELWDSCFDKETRTCARKALRSGLKVEERTTRETASALHRLYRGQAASWRAGRVYPARLLGAIIENMNGKARIWTGSRGDRVLCAVLVLYFGDTLMAWLSGQDAEGRNVRASHLVYAEIIKDACAKGLAIFNFGGSGTLEGVRFFKESFGAREFSYSVLIREPPLFELARKVRRIALRME
ncbi:MAG: GNAT family N-acetyltransferase [Candidatus Eisenbacteria bacterium]